MLTGSYHPGREPWVIHVYRIDPGGNFSLETVWTPANPGPLNGAWAFTHGPIHECRYGELGLDHDPGWPPDSRLLLIWEQPDTGQKPDFIGTAGILRGGRSELGGSYTLPVLGLGDLDAKGLAGTYTAVGGWVNDTISAHGLELGEPKRGETVEAHHARLLAPFPDGGWGVRPDGQRVIGRPSGGAPVNLGAEQVQRLQSSGYERQAYVTEAVGNPGERWATLVQTRLRPTVLTPRVLAAAGTDNLILPDVEFVVRLNFVQLISRSADQADEGIEATYGQANFTGPRPEKTVYLTLPAAATVRGDAPAPRSSVRVKVRISVPLSQIVRESATSRHALAARWSLKNLLFPFRAYVTGGKEALTPPAHEDYELAAPTAADTGAVLSLRDWLSQTPDGRWEDALSHLSQGERPLQGAELQLRLSPPQDLIAEAYESIGGGTYHYLLEVWVDFPAAQQVYRRRPGRDASLPAYVTLVRGGRVHLEVGRPGAITDALAEALPPENLPDGWDAPTYSDPTFQGEVAGRLIAPAVITGLPRPDGLQLSQVVTELRRVRTHSSYHTTIQTAARQTRQLTAAEQQLKTAKEGSAW
ncbi:hypothetical protein QOL99_00135 [Deinococcus sp. MIMF12]|uniref:Uncharacterized protein n=1 Tax=Deinococcus rhizophilus TaxID=3049544 RepID=A0ABT7JBX6_9DEIO|nr:hypothetical protein [Deinococcus rhizophilus]MDL2342556.1 hypothetical protein [Deinococcus rhizophilus]